MLSSSRSTIAPQTRRKEREELDEDAAASRKGKRQKNGQRARRIEGRAGRGGWRLKKILEMKKTLKKKLDLLDAGRIR